MGCEAFLVPNIGDATRRVQKSVSVIFYTEEEGLQRARLTRTVPARLNRLDTNAEWARILAKTIDSSSTVRELTKSCSSSSPDSCSNRRDVELGRLERVKREMESRTIEYSVWA